MSGLYLPGATFRPISYRAAAGAFTAPPLGYIVHVPVGVGSLFDYFNNLKSPNRKFSTAWVAKDGTSEQYTTLDMQCWAQAAGNPLYWAFEVEGYPNEPMTDAQIATLATWHNFLGVADVVATAPGQKGVGTHSMGGAAWGGHSCPGTIRAAQLPQIITSAQALRTKDWFDMATPADLQAAVAAGIEDKLDEIASEVWNRFKVRDSAGNLVSLQDALSKILAASGSTGGTVDLDALAAKVSADIAQRMQS